MGKLYDLSSEVLQGAEALVELLDAINVTKKPVLDRETVESALRSWMGVSLKVVFQYIKVLALRKRAERDLATFEATAHTQALSMLTEKKPTLKDIESWIVGNRGEELMRLQEVLEDFEVGEALLKEVKDVVRGQKDILQTLSVSLRTGSATVEMVEASSHGEKIEEAKQEIRRRLKHGS